MQIFWRSLWCSKNRLSIRQVVTMKSNWPTIWTPVHTLGNRMSQASKGRILDQDWDFNLVKVSGFEEKCKEAGRKVSWAKIQGEFKAQRSWVRTCQQVLVIQVSGYDLIGQTRKRGCKTDTWNRRPATRNASLSQRPRKQKSLLHPTREHNM